ncbi:MAG: agmatine deiminase [Cyclobacteriaceae bacterium]|nr:MAG: agmatine deiminase [Cyclobacteriaceae bacterium]
MKVDQSVFQQGYFFPAEWEQHRATWLSWPHNPQTWPGDIDSIFDGYIDFVKEIAKSETVCINVADKTMESNVRCRLAEHNVDQKNIRCYNHPTNDTWCRDHGPCFLINSMGDKIIVDWEYNAWGNKYPPFNLDNAIPKHVASALKLKYYHPGMVLEGGSVEFNGQGTVLTTTSCLLNHNRNPGLSKQTIESKLRKIFGVTQVIWLDHGIAGDDTDGHIDTITRFINPNTVVTVVEHDRSEINYQPLQNNLNTLKKIKLINGQALDIVPLPMPAPKYHRGQRLPASYANFYICNGSVLVPTYRDANDQVALDILSGLFPKREVVGIDSLEIVRGLGSLHCLSMQEPAV